MDKCEKCNKKKRERFKWDHSIMSEYPKCQRRVSSQMNKKMICGDCYREIQEGGFEYGYG